MFKLQLKEIEKTYPNGYQAIKKVNLDVQEGEFIVFVGPSGCGKSTLLRMIAGLESISSGELHLNGKKINHLEPADRDIAMVFQNYALYPHMTVYNNMAYGLKNRGYQPLDIKIRIQEAADILDIGAQLEKKPNQLSGGQRQRVAMGRAIVRHPELFLFDEPLSNLDAKLRTQTRVELKKLHNRLTATTIYVTHDQVEAMTMADKIVILNKGEIEQFGSPSELYNHPSSMFVAGFLGSPSMNFISPHLLNYSPEIAHVAGIRPEHLHIDGNESRDCQLMVTIELIEDLGADCLIHTRAQNGDSILVRGNPKRIGALKLGDEILLYFRKIYTHFFNQAEKIIPFS